MSYTTMKLISGYQTSSIVVRAIAASLGWMRHNETSYGQLPMPVPQCTNSVSRETWQAISTSNTLSEMEIAMRILMYLALTALLAGCTTQAELTAQAEREVAQMIKVYGPACEKLGYRRDSDPWRDCVLSLDAKESTLRYNRYPTSTTCFGHRGFFQCTTF